MFNCFWVFFFGHATQHVGAQYSNQALNSCPLYWKHRVLNPGLPRKFPCLIFHIRKYMESCIFVAFQDILLFPPSGEYNFNIIEFSLFRGTVLEILTNVFRQVASPQSSPNFSFCLLIVNTLHHS